MSDQSIRAHVAEMDRKRKAFSEFWRTQLMPKYRNQGKVSQSAAMIAEWNVWRKVTT